MRFALSRLLALMISSVVFVACGGPDRQEGVAPTLALVDEPHFRVGDPGVLRITTGGSPAPGLSIVGTLPTGVAFDAEAKTIAGTPAMGTGRLYPLTLRAFNGVGSDAVLEFSLRVDEEEAQKLAPSLDFPSSLTLIIGRPVEQGFNVRGAPPPSLSLVAGTLPPGLALDGDAYRLQGIPTATGHFPGIEVRATNAAGSALVSFSIQVTEPPPAPVATDDAFDVIGHMAIDVPAGGGVLHNDTPSNAVIAGFGPHAEDAVRGPPGATITTAQGGEVTLSSDGAFSFLPAAGFSGTDGFAYTLENEGGTSVGTVVFTVHPHRVWFVDAAAGEGGTGTQGQPFGDLASVPVTAHADIIYVKSAPTLYASRILDAGVRLIGQGVEVDEDMLGFSPPVYTRPFPPADTAPKLRTLVLADDSRVMGVDLEPLPGERGLVGGGVARVMVQKVSVRTTEAAAVDLRGVGGTVILRSVTASGGTTGIFLSDTTGLFTVSGDGSQERNGSGGQLSTDGTAVVLRNARNVSLHSLVISGVPVPDCVSVEGVENLTITGGDLGPCSEGLRLKESLMGRISVSGTRIRATRSAFEAVVSVGALGELQFLNNQLQGGIQGPGFSLRVHGNGHLATANIANNLFVGPGVDTGIAVVSVAVGQGSPTFPTAAPSARVNFIGNRISNVNGNAARFLSYGEAGQLRVAVRGNTFVSAGGAAAAPPMLQLESGSNLNHVTLLCADVRDNVATLSGEESGIKLVRWNQTNAEFGLVGLPPGQNAAGVQSFVTGSNPQGGGAILGSTGSGFTPCLLN